MGKISNAIQMLNYLNTGNKYTVKELSEKIGITERMVRYYKVELEQAGIPIETFMGPNGGYYILNIKNQYNHFNKYDLQLLENINMILEKLGGGGHITLAGAQVEGMTIEEVKQELIIRINEYFTEIEN